jgi:hypothetical protein
MSSGRLISACVGLAVFSAIAVHAAFADPAVAPSAAAPGPYESSDSLTGATDNPIDKLVLDRLKELDIQPALVCSDSVFVRRVFLDVIGTLPTEQEARAFLTSSEPNKRAALIDKLLARDEFTDYWAMKWSDLLRVKAEYPINLWPNAAQAYYHWIRDSIRKNKPYDQFARELLLASGSNFRAPPANFYRAMQSKEPASIAQTVALTFMGCRAEKWPKERLAGMAAFFSQVGYKPTGEWKEEIVFYDPTKGDFAKIKAAAVFPDGVAAKLVADHDPREAFADWLIDAKNPYFTRAIANRVWSWLVGRGIIHEPDDIRLPSPDNPPVNPQLLDYLERELVKAKYDLKTLYRLILNSRTYQLSCVPRSASPQAAANFAFYRMRQLDAEVLIDALCEITGTTEKYSSSTPEPFTFIPERLRSIALPDGSITSSFLEEFGRAPRDTGLESERNTRATAAQRLALLNSSHVQGKIAQSRKLGALIKGRSTGREIADALYLTILSRFPTPAELKVLGDYSQSSLNNQQKREAVIDMIWALINSDEFLFRH